MRVPLEAGPMGLRQRCPVQPVHLVLSGSSEGAPASLTAVSSGGLWWVLVPLGVRALHQLQTFPPLPFVNRV